MNVAIMATDGRSVFRYKPDMSKSTRFKKSAPPATPMNQWARDALAHFDKSMQEVADLLNEKDLGAKYDRSKVQKMTVARKVSKMEAEALAEITGYPLSDDDAQQMMFDFDRLKPGDKSLVRSMISSLRAKQEAS